jgi:hypothetical protein
VIESHVLCRWLEERKVIAIRRSTSDVLLDLETVRGDEPVRRVTLHLNGVTAERAHYYIGDKVTAPHPDPSWPLDLIEVAEYEAPKLSLQGYRNSEPWYVWEIWAAEIGIEEHGEVPST